MAAIVRWQGSVRLQSCGQVVGGRGYGHVFFGEGRGGWLSVSIRWRSPEGVVDVYEHTASGSSLLVAGQQEPYGP